MNEYGNKQVKLLFSWILHTGKSLAGSLWAETSTPLASSTFSERSSIHIDNDDTLNSSMIYNTVLKTKKQHGRS